MMTSLSEIRRITIMGHRRQPPIALPLCYRHWRVAGIAAAAMFLLAACSTGKPGPYHVPHSVGKPYKVNGIAYVPHEDPDYDVVGVASWYGGRFHGRRTASGQIFNMHAHTAAHKTLPLGTRVKVTNLANGRSVVLTINDRGPFAKGRIIDVSQHAAQQLDFKHRGTARVRVQVIGSASG
jgi:rare lipoprotein A (peptidoglycan hydrolase)